MLIITFANNESIARLRFIESPSGGKYLVTHLRNALAEKKQKARGESNPSELSMWIILLQVIPEVSKPNMIKFWGIGTTNR